MCQSCPFSGSEQGEEGINLGCLPSPYEILQLKREQNSNWMCHHNESKSCAGFRDMCAELNINPLEGENLKYTKWYHG